MAAYAYLALRHGVFRGPLEAAMNYKGGISGKAWALIEMTSVTLLGIDWTECVHLSADGKALHWALYDAGTPHLGSLQWVPQAWSLAVEELFCLTLPLWLSMSSRTLAWLLFLGQAARSVIVIFGHMIPFAWCFPPLEISCFFAGILAWRYHLAHAQEQKGPVYKAGLLAWGGMILFSQYLGIYTAFQFPLYILASIVLLGSLFQLSAGLPWDRALADFSYPIYLVHLLIFEVCRALNWMPAFLPSSLFIFALSIPASLLLLHFVIRPSDRWRRRFLAPGAALLLPLLLLSGCAGGGKHKPAPLMIKLDFT
jgi:peptidoglycan/LPS O-acetylase OafA/YrhL